MSTFNDAQMRSDEFAQRSRMFYDQQRYGADQQAGAAIQRAGQQIPETLHAGRALDQRSRALGQQALAQNAEIMQAQQALDQKAVEIAHTAAAQQGELQLGQQKLAHALAIDGTEMSFQQVRQATLANDAMELQLKEGNRRFESADKNELAELNAQAARALAAAGNYGYEYDPTQPPSMQFRKRSDKERETAIAEAREGRTRIGGSDGNEDVDRKRILNEIADLEDLFYGAKKGSPERAKWQRAIDRAKSRYHAMAERGAPAERNNGQVPQAQPQPAAAKPAEKPTYYDNVVAEAVMRLQNAMGSRMPDMASQTPMTRQGAMDQTKEIGARIVAFSQNATDFAVRHRERLLPSMRSGRTKGREGIQFTEDDAVREFMRAASDPNDELHPLVMKLLQQAGIAP